MWKNIYAVLPPEFLQGNNSPKEYLLVHRLCVLDELTGVSKVYGLKNFLRKINLPGIGDNSFYMRSDTIESQIQNLEQQIRLQESNYKYAMELKKDCIVLRRMRYNIRALRELLQSLKEHSKKAGGYIFPTENYIFKDF